MFSKKKTECRVCGYRSRNGFQQVTGYNIEGITENQPVYLDFEQVAAVVRVFSDEKEVAHDEQGASIL